VTATGHSPSIGGVYMSVYVPLLIVARQRLGKEFSLHEFTRNSRKILRRFVFYTSDVVSKESRL
jgi:hypothetical protein